MGDMLSRESILAADDIETEIVDVPEWGGSVRVRGMSGKQRDRWEASLSERRNKRYVPNLENIRAKLVVECVVDENGQQLFQFGDVEALGLKSASALNRVYEVAARLSGVTDEDVEELAQNFRKTPGDATSSASPSTSVLPFRGSSETPTVTN